jgi:glycerate-2-kinase
LNAADGRVGRVDDAGGGVGGGVSQRLSRSGSGTAIAGALRWKNATEVFDAVDRACSGLVNLLNQNL